MGQFKYISLLLILFVLSTL